MSETFERIYRRHAATVFRFAVSCVGRRDIAEEITSDAFLALFRNLEAIDESQLPAWLITVAKNKARDYWRRQATELKYMETIPSASASMEDHRAASLLDNPRLKPLHRICLTLRYVEDMTRAEIAAFTGLSESQVKGYLRYGLHILRKSVVAEDAS